MKGMRLRLLIGIMPELLDKGRNLNTIGASSIVSSKMELEIAVIIPARVAIFITLHPG